MTPAGAPSAADGRLRHLETHGWQITVTNDRRISGEATIEACSQELGGVVSLPEMLFAGSSVQLRHAASGWAIRFEALDALRAWRQEALPPLQVTVAEAWQHARKEEIKNQDASMLEYDWTFTTPYAGTLLHTASSGGGGGGDDSSSGGGGDGSSAGGDGGSSEQPPSKSTTLGESMSGQAQDQQPDDQPQSSAAAGTQQPGRQPRWQATAEQLDRGLLMARDPILFYADLPLYESELDDNGVCLLGVRLRVMPRCWFAMLRFWLRVDGCLIRLRETRLMCRWGGGGCPTLLHALQARPARAADSCALTPHQAPCRRSRRLHLQSTSWLSHQCLARTPAPARLQV